jgi:hypothetical protein
MITKEEEAGVVVQYVHLAMSESTGTANQRQRASLLHSIGNIRTTERDTATRASSIILGT